MANENTFHIGICMAGAISAGAYTAGVIDYLLESLENWQKAKELQNEGKLEGIPKHDIKIHILSGASAGGMTAAITSAAIQTKFEHVYKEDIQSNSDKLAKNPLYNSWVNLTETDSEDMMDFMLGTGDIERNNNNRDKEVRSIFNSDFINTVAQRFISKQIIDPSFKRPYFAQDFEVVATLTNLNGIPFEVDFNNPNYTRVHVLKRHFDMAHFIMKQDGKYNKDGKIPLHFNDEEGCNKDILIQSAKATGGFPIGLEPRIVNRMGKYIKDNEYINLGKQPELHNITNIDNFETLNIDGGTINNDPFELTQKIIDKRLNIKSKVRKTKVEEFISAVLMIDPFPNHNDIPKPGYKISKALKFIVTKVLSAMMGELRMKEGVLKSAIDTDDYTRFLIIPSRTGADKDKENHIACGSIGGFGGFFSKKFRQHDYLLGRRNCQQFLRKHFSIPLDKTNPILEFGYSGIKDQYKEKYKGSFFLPLIPDIRVEVSDGGDSFNLLDRVRFREDEFDYPKIKLRYLMNLEKKFFKRFKSILTHITNGENPNQDNPKYDDDLIKRIRRKKWFARNITGPLSKRIVRIFLKRGMGKATSMLSEQAVNYLIQDFQYNDLLDIDK